MQSPEEILQQYWGHSSFRPLQREIISSALDGNDVLALLPTGGGKSICFQVPAMMMEGLCLVISPLIALMKDQVENLKKRNIPALSIQSGMSYFEVKQTLQNAAYGPYKFLYVSPERLETDLFKEYLQAFNLNLIAVDEAHCISQWGYDFRPPYLRIATLREFFPQVPIIALTASATPKVQDDICDNLLFKQKNIFRQSFEKPNLSFSVFKEDSKLNKLLDILEKVPGTAIVYCRNRIRTKEIAHYLRLNKIGADYYHAGLSQQDRSQKQEDWINNVTRVIVCTNAFGMGIDKPDVRVVIHADIPDNLENYYQEAGRAGRDGKRSYAVLIHSLEEMENLKKLPDIKYPSISDIKKVYQAVANHLQIAVGSGQGMYYSFNLTEFIKYFKMDVFLVINALKSLEQEGYLSFNEQVFLPAKVGFTCTKEEVEQACSKNSVADIVIKSLLRGYQGVFDNEVSISENVLSRLGKLPIEEIRKQLIELQSFGIVQYQPQKETPQIYFVENRASAEYLVFNTEAYLLRKKLYAERVEVMQNYVTLERNCRSQYIGYYFGDMVMKACGICDNCLSLKRNPISDAEFTIISAKLFEQLKGKSIEVNKLLQMTGIKKEKIWTVIDFLQTEGKLKVGKGGLVELG